MPEPSEQETELQRKESLRRLAGALQLGAPLEEAFAPGTIGCHEAMHGLSLVLDAMERHVLDHPAIAARADWHRIAAIAHYHMMELYQGIGAVHLEAAEKDA